MRRQKNKSYPELSTQRKEKTGEKIAAEFVGSLGGAVPEHPGAGRSSVIKPLMI